MSEAVSIRDRVAGVFSHPAVTRAFRFLTENERGIEDDQIRLTTIPAPPFAEAARSRAFAAELSAMGFAPTIDDLGNVTAPYADSGSNPIVLGAHLDTVFPAPTSLEAVRKGRLIYLPGSSDNGAGIVAVLWAFRAAKEAEIRFRRPVLAVGDVGEEGEGNLRGIRHLFKSSSWARQCDFIAVDGAGLQRITNQALGSRRFRVRMIGQGGHSWADFGRPNPIHAIASVVHDFVKIGPFPGTSFNVGVIRGGMSVNAIPVEAVIEVDLRSISADYLEQLQRHLNRCVGESARKSGLEIRVELMGERPIGRTAVESDLVQAALLCTRRLGVEPQLDIGSTDANVPMSLGIPAIALGGGGSCGGVHTTNEWFDPTDRDRGLHRLLALVGVLAGLD
jgi:acetylornithine deacetylase/succinyl-diaminopimelate desuccinylase-like protein